jgi:hypothetical protein
LKSDSSVVPAHDFEGAEHHEAYQYMPAATQYLEGLQVARIEILKMCTSNVTDSTVAMPSPETFDYSQPVRFFNYKAAQEPYTRLMYLPFALDSAHGNIVRIDTLTILLHLQPPATEAHARKREESAGSVLAEGAWYKLGVVREGIYRLDARFFRELGIDPASIDPATLQIFGNGGKMLPQANSAFRYDDLEENSIYVHGEADGRFDDGDYLLFFGQDPHTRFFDTETLEFTYDNHIYSDTAFYFLRLGTEQGVRMPLLDAGSPVAYEIAGYDDAVVHERDLVSFLYTGREWYGERLPPGTQRTIDLDIPGIIPDSQIKLRLAILGQTEVEASVDAFLNDQPAGTIALQKINLTPYGLKGIESVTDLALGAQSVQSGTGSYRLGLRLNSGSLSTKAFLNYCIVFTKRRLAVYGEQTFFQALESKAVNAVQYRIAQAGSPAAVWDVSEPMHPAVQAVRTEGNDVLFTAEGGNLRRYAVFYPEQLAPPVSARRIANQNLRGANACEFLIIAHPLFRPEAERLAGLRRTVDGLDVRVVTTEEVFNEFSSGAQDVTALRDFVKHVYDLEDPPVLKNVLLFGRGSVDFKDVTGDNTNFVPIYASRNALHELKSYASDDFYGFLDDDEGMWQEDFSGDHMMDVGVGRLPVKTPDEARIMVDKLYLYRQGPQRYGPWRKRVVFVADDGDFNIHQRDAERLAEMVDTTARQIAVEKIYIDAYEQVGGNTGETAPGAAEALQKAIEKGALIVNFTGHGSETRWTAETILNLTMINALENPDRLPLFVTATCEFGRHDDPRIISGGEYLLLNPIGGAIGLVTTSRPVFSSTNYLLNEAFYSNVFEKAEGAYQDLGTVFMKTKNESLNGSINRNFSLLGDPSMRLAYPDYSIRIVLDTLIGDDGILQPLEKAVLHGEVLDESGELAHAFDGILEAEIFDRKYSKETLGNENPVMQYAVRDAVFRGEVTVENGLFDIYFIVPQNITYDIDQGKISLYAYNKERTFDALGASVDYRIGGEASEPEEDITPPAIDLYINDTTFVRGGITGPDIALIAIMHDEHGLDLTATDENTRMKAVLDGEMEYDLRGYYIARTDTYKVGQVTFPIKDLSTGSHHVLVQASDVYGNAGTGSVDFLVVEGPLAIEKLIGYPNPFRDYTRIGFEHNRAGDDLEINAEVINATGQVVKTFRTVRENAESRLEAFEWDTSGYGGKVLESGLYILKVHMRSLKDGTSRTASIKLVLIN